ncbi:hypothetical protein [Rhodopirellula sallentina]|uniref:Uncharacterized protein n=1 Tax=Rhodopirellula sallentina SM41 TaxID=1263870 RepID=M5U318_9BACT|nr:hypothetical protein [Rhodopirellula sallentina]EMI52241.1 hypothetical protein RSSM_06355 [Rhodopirellula sallentina SM41]
MSDPNYAKSSTTSDPDADCFAEVTNGIYRNVVPESVWRAIRFAVRHELPAKNPTIMMMFVRIAEVYDNVHAFLSSKLPEATGPERSAMALILDPPTGIRNAEYLPDEIESPGEMDLCWSEFLVTGELSPIEKVVAVLDREDRSRHTIDTLLSKETDSPVTVDDNAIGELGKIGIVLGQTNGQWKIVSPGDIDVLLWFGIKDQIPTCVQFFELMNEEQRVHIANKGAAMWSLRANASQHGKIRMFCEEQSQLEGGRARLLISPAS